MDSPDEPVDEVVQRLRQLAWAVPISRDHMLRTVAEMPPIVREHIDERAQRTAEQLTAFRTQILGLLEDLATLPDEAVLSAGLVARLANLSLPIERSLKEVDLLVEDMNSLFGAPPDPKTCN